MRAFLLLLVAAAVALLAGCATDDDGATGDGNDNTTGNNSSVRNETFSVPINIQASGPIGPTGSRAEGAVAVEANATAIIMEAQWECASAPSCDLTFSLLDPEGNEVATGQGSGTATLALEAENATGLAPGDYILRATPGTPGTVGMSGEARAVVFYGPVPDGFSPFAEEAEATTRDE